ncbi:MAG: hypothetical protein CMG09_05560 [Candidatus Marinimicrobia bacterium]|nr:hypothetical protein [Candidatus Neomarinimicrobiota bacterium]|tara:strand:- start:1743 stop:2822 length:1080 start_codon:yes stop_codon:yes gene_type:complete
MKNVTKILTAVVLCAAIFASTQRTDALGGNPALWPGDEANIANFPGSINDHSHVQVTGVGSATNGVTGAQDNETATILFDKDGTKWGFSINDDKMDWFNIMWGNGDMGLSIGMLSSEDGGTTNNVANNEEASGFKLGWGQTMGFGDLGVTYVSTSMTDAGNGASKTVTDVNNIGVNWRGDVGFWVFDGLTASLQMDDTDKATTGTTTGQAGDVSSTTLSVTGFTHMDAGGADVLFALGVENKSGEEYNATSTATNKMDDTGHMHLNTTIAVEANMTDWATFRLGATYAYQLSGENDWTGPGGTSTGTGWELGTGLGFNWGGFSADYHVSQDFFNDPVSHITGYSSDKLTDHGVTLTYSF